MMRLGGAIPLIIKNEFSDDNWKAELEHWMQHPLESDGLKNVLECLKGVAIYLVDRHQDAEHVDCAGSKGLR